MKIIFKLKDKTLIAAMAGEIDHHVCDQIRADMDNQIELYGVEHLILDFGQVSFMDSSGIGMVLGRYKKLKESGGRVTIRNASPLVKQLLEMSGIFSLMEYEDTAKDGKEEKHGN